ncbi:MAG TPA: chromosome segregation protein SMC [Hyphomicrobiales bacterium]|nr:chromosome segregation protein SMC [Hyphomicrobiales bacterium]
MRLKSIKLAGFKSFVDPTTVNFPSNLCAVVGPNGCGKSNIIDAVRWVMGESSAKNLRGESMTDVIFNGSSNRKPVGQASVELVFDNSDRTVTGEYAGFNEISIKRIVNSDAQSTYMLNGTKCRRRDITDIFLGTGLGPRSYSIIEQGMVSRLIESKPEDLRVFIEEAAGISKYKERRKETESRISRTKENLERLTDIREELDRQLQHLQRQARSAEKYREYKQEERDTTARLASLRWQRLDREVNESQGLIGELEVQLEASNARYRAVEAEIERLRDGGVDAHETYQRVQATYYGLGGEVSRLEQNIEHQRQRKMQLEEDLRATRESLERTQAELSTDLDKIAALDEETAMLEPQLDGVREQEELASAALDEAEQAMLRWQGEWDQFNQESAGIQRKAEVEQQRINHLENIVDRGLARKTNLSRELEGLATDPESEQLALLEHNLGELSMQQSSLERDSAGLSGEIDATRQALKASSERLNQERSRLQTLLGRQSSLEALQQQALGAQEQDQQHWLREQQLHTKPRLVDGLKVEHGWETALELVLGEHLQAICVDDIASFGGVLPAFDKGLLTLRDRQPAAAAPTNAALAAHALAAKASAEFPLDSLLGGVYAVDTLDQALDLRAALRPGESLVTRDGIWLGSDWLRLARGFDPRAGMIQRQEELGQLAATIAELDALIDGLLEESEDLQQQLREREQRKEDIIRQLGDVNRSLTEYSADRSARLMKIEQVSERRKRLRHEIDELERQLQTEQQNITNARSSLQAALDQMEADSARREEHLQSRDECRRVLDEARQKARQDRDQAHQLALRHQTMLAQLSSLKVSLERSTVQVRGYEQRRDQLQLHLKNTDDPIPGLKAELDVKLAARQDIERELTAAKNAVDDIDHQLRELETQRGQSQDASQRLRDALVEHRLGIEGATVKRAALEQQLQELAYQLQAVLEALPEDCNESGCEQSLEQIGQRIQRLGPINLAAIEEYETQSQRKVYLDAQNEELEKALSTLENAIRKIDKETRTRFKETFDKINNGLQQLFPKVFGGGHAYLDMVGEDLLDTGVAIMARPPGKKNSTIHLLSGGEKAMTAIALVFSIFQLNPSPFCMLDEVDAPLDDANVGRYANLVKEMSEVVQFIYITHNRLTMESANQLLGVTMHEPGVSRLVSVDIDEATELAAM